MVKKVLMFAVYLIEIFHCGEMRNFTCFSRRPLTATLHFRDIDTHLRIDKDATVHVFTRLMFHGKVKDAVR